MNIWDKTKELKFALPSDIKSGIEPEFPMGSEYEELRYELVKFIEWVEENYNIQIPVLVDFVDKNYLVENGKRCGYLFYYHEFENYPEFNDALDLPYIVVPVKGYNVKWSLRDILGSFIEALTDYFAWLDNSLEEDADIQEVVEEILKRYFNE